MNAAAEVLASGGRLSPRVAPAVGAPGRRRVAVLGLLLAVALLQACATRRDMQLDESLFPRASVASEPRLPGRLAVRLSPAAHDLVHEGEDGPARALRIPIGRIVAQAMLASAGEAFADGAERVEAATPDDARYAATLTVQSIRVAYQSRFLWMLPIPLLGGVGDFELNAHLGLDLSVRDAQGRVVWTRTYDDGRRVWQHDWVEQGKAPDGLLRLTHEAAWRLAQQAMADLREWAAAERTRVRSP